jgi:hypothetical protein
VEECRKLTVEACTHAAQNERLSLRVVLQVLFFEQLQLWRAITDTLLASAGAPHRLPEQQQRAALRDTARPSDTSRMCRASKGSAPACGGPSRKIDSRDDVTDAASSSCRSRYGCKLSRFSTTRMRATRSGPGRRGWR